MNGQTPLTERLGTASGTAQAREGSAGTEPASNRVVLAISGPGFSDSEEFEVADVRAARAAARKLVASAIRAFGRTETDAAE